MSKNNLTDLRCLNEVKFDREKTLQALIEDNLDNLFGNLELLGSEVNIGNSKFDSLVYDSGKRCFVIIEYKIKENYTVYAQGVSYLKLLQNRKADIVDLYNAKKKVRVLSNYFNWKKCYVMFFSPQFHKHDANASSSDSTLQFYQINKYESGIIVLYKLSNKKIMVLKQKTESNDNPILSNLSESEKLYLDNKRADKNTIRLYSELRNKILETLDNMYIEVQKYSVKFYHKNTKLTICSLVAWKSKIDLIYSAKKFENILVPSDFIKDVSDIGKWGNGDYRSYIKNDQNIKPGLEYIKKVYDHKIKD